MGSGNDIGDVANISTSLPGIIIDFPFIPRATLCHFVLGNDIMLKMLLFLFLFFLVGIGACHGRHPTKLTLPFLPAHYNTNAVF